MADALRVSNGPADAVNPSPQGRKSRSVLVNGYRLLRPGCPTATRRQRRALPAELVEQPPRLRRLVRMRGLRALEGLPRRRTGGVPVAAIRERPCEAEAGIEHVGLDQS